LAAGIGCRRIVPSAGLARSDSTAQPQLSLEPGGGRFFCLDDERDAFPVVRVVRGRRTPLNRAGLRSGQVQVQVLV